jgi:UDP-3-O-[3-hydroxymyristoyl] glucosamine N-acyltransferase
VRGVGDLRGAREDDATYIADVHYARLWQDCSARVALVSDGIEVAGHDPSTRTLVRVGQAEIAMISLLESFAPPPETPASGIHPTACVETEGLDPSISVGPNAWIARRCTIGSHAVIHSGARIYSGVRIGARTVVHANAIIRERCEIGSDAIIHAGAVIGTEGFGYRPCPSGKGLLRIPHLGNVVLGDGVEIGSCTCVDRGTFGSTRVGRGTKIDNHCQIGHNVQIGHSTVIAGLSGVAGSCTIGDWVRIGAGSGIADHRNVGNGAQLAARTALMHDVPPGEIWGGMPAREIKVEMRHVLALQKLSPLSKDLQRLVEQSRATRSSATAGSPPAAQ